MTAIPARIRDSWRARGFVGMVTLGFRRVANIWRARYEEWKFDRELGVDTRGTSGGFRRARIIDRLDPESRRTVTGFGPTPLRAADEIIASLPIRKEDFTFVDVGSGKGRVLLIAARSPFKRVVGVEISEELHKVATANIRNRRDPLARCADVQSTCFDASLFEIPSGPVVFWVFNPFQIRDPMNVLLSRIEASWREDPRPMLFVYLNPRLASLVDEVPIFERVPPPKNYELAMYRTRPSEKMTGTS